MTRALYVRSWLVLVAGTGLIGCSFEAPPEGAQIVSNSCSVDADCIEDTRCTGGMCVARSVENSLRIVLDVTPLQTPDGPAPVPIAIGSFDLQDRSMTPEWQLPRPITVRGRVRDGASIVDADVTLTAASEFPGIPAKAVMATVAGSVGGIPEHDFEVRVAREGEYTLRVQPKDTNLPPLQRTQTIVDGEDIVVDYAELELDERTVEIDVLGIADDRPLVVRAVDLLTGISISSSAPVANGHATLRFSSEPEDYRIVVRPEGAYDPEGQSDSGDCDHDTPVLPTFSIAASDVDVVEEDGVEVLQLELPEAPTRVRYEGSIVLCEGSTTREPLPITLRSTAVALGESAGQWRAEVATDSEAIYRSSQRRYTFCVDVFQGDYAIVVTPPASEPCEIFAERRTINSQNGVYATSQRIDLLKAAQVAGTLRTLDDMKLAATTVDVQSLGREVEELHTGDGSLTSYNRSRQTTTDDEGAFTVSVDRGSYDIALKPPPGSGYAWYVRRDVTIGSGTSFANPIEMALPIALDCEITYARGDEGASTLAGAEVTAYGVVTNDEGAERAVAVGKAVADDSGRFMILLPVEIGVGLW